MKTRYIIHILLQKIKIAIIHKIKAGFKLVTLFLHTHTHIGKVDKIRPKSSFLFIRIPCTFLEERKDTPAAKKSSHKAVKKAPNKNLF